MADDLKTYLATLAQESGLDEATSKAVLQAIENEKFGKAVTDGFARQSDYSRKMDDFTKQKTAWTEWKDQVQAMLDTNNQELTSVRAKALAYEQTYGPLNGDKGTAGAPQPRNENGEFISKKDAEAYVNQIRQGNVELTRDMTVIQGRHWGNFGRPLSEEDVKAIEVIAVQSGVKLPQAYEQFAGPKLHEKTNAEWEAKLKVAREEGAKDALSKHHLPVDSPATPQNPWLVNAQKEAGKPVTGTAPSTLKDSFVEAWNQDAATAKS